MAASPAASTAFLAASPAASTAEAAAAAMAGATAEATAEAASATGVAAGAEAGAATGAGAGAGGGVSAGLPQAARAAAAITAMSTRDLFICGVPVKRRLPKINLLQFPAKTKQISGCDVCLVSNYSWANMVFSLDAVQALCLRIKTHAAIPPVPSPAPAQTPGCSAWQSLWTTEHAGLPDSASALRLCRTR